MAGGDCAVVCAMSGNFVQRGDVAVLRKHARAAAAITAGADLVIELPLPTVLSSAEGFARGGVLLLESLGVCKYLSFGSEAGEIKILEDIAACLLTSETSARIKEELKSGVSYASARQNAVTQILGEKADILKKPNNILGIEYLKALQATKSQMQPLTIRRIGAAHDSFGAESASHLRHILKAGKEPWALMPKAASVILQDEITSGRGPVFMEALDTALLSRLRLLSDSAYKDLPDASEGVETRLMRYARTMPTLPRILEAVKTKRYAMSRLRRMLVCAALGITRADTLMPPAYIRVLAMNDVGKRLLREIKALSPLTVITKPAEAKTLDETARCLFQKDCNATDFYVLAYPDPTLRIGGQEWTVSPRIL